MDNQIEIQGILKATKTRAIDGKVFVDVLIRCEMNNGVVRLMPRAEQGFSIKLRPDQPELTGLDIALNIASNRG